ncbi:beta-1,4-mannooligosaccharide/beta-1,4-mannosyl-N-acetylglucosamine phosphorylase [Anaerotaenia torta]|uniref:glycoside hydrolase family 130 protein n=1 Tax=Anaerotaenia torta TaxID=433293 RepID=UPI003D1B1E54
MSEVRIIGTGVKNIPWQEKPEGCGDVLWRHTENPIMGRNKTARSARIYNSAVLPYNGKFVGIFRADHKDGIPQLHVGYSEDGIKWELEDEDIHWVDEEGEEYNTGYAYDPRLVELEDRYYILWCTDFGGPTIGLGVTEDFKTFVRLENSFIPFNRNGVLFPRKINGHYAMLSRPSDSGHTPFGDIFLSYSPDLTFWGRHRRVMTSGHTWWQGTKIGAGAVPIETTEGWLLFYHGVCGTCNGFVYSIGAAILDRENPAKVLYRTKDYIMTPEADYEVSGFVPNVTFPCSALFDADTGRIAIYYGAADTCLGIAYARVEELVDHVKNNSYLLPGDGVEYR